MVFFLINHLAGLDSSITEGRRRRGSRDSKWPIACASSSRNVTEAQSISDYSLDGFGEDTTTTDEDNDGDDDDDDSSSLSMSAVAIPMY